MKFFSLLLLFLTTSISLAQYPVRDIPINLRNKVNAVVRNNETIITLNDFNDMNIMQKEVGTILNKNGLELMKTYLHFDKSTNVKKISLRIFDANGEEIKKYKKRDFTDVSASGNSLYMDYRVMYYNYVPPKVSKKTTSSSSSSGYSRLTNNTRYTLKQALAICNPQAKLFKNNHYNNQHNLKHCRRRYEN